MPLPEVFADGISGVRIVGDTVRLEFASLAHGDPKAPAFEPRVRLVLPASALPGMIDVLKKAQESRQPTRPGPKIVSAV